MKIRTQLSLYVPKPVRALLDEVRQLLDPIQAKLIPAHVTLCREDEIINLDSALLRSRLLAMKAQAMTLEFGRPESFHGHGVRLPCIAGESEFHALRELVLGTAAIRREIPHITLAHPRNPKTLSNTTANVSRLPSSLTITFANIKLIQQQDHQPWQVFDQFAPTSSTT